MFKIRKFIKKFIQIPTVDFQEKAQKYNPMQNILNKKLVFTDKMFQLYLMGGNKTKI